MVQQMNLGENKTDGVKTQKEAPWSDGYCGVSHNLLLKIVTYVSYRANDVPHT